MPFKLSKPERERRDDIVKRLSHAYAAIEESVDAFNDKLDEIKAPVLLAVEKYNEIVAEAQQLAEDIASQADSDIADKSEKWQESERGQAAEEFKSEWENLSFEEIEIELPDEVSADDPGHASELEAAPEELAA